MRIRKKNYEILRKNVGKIFRQVFVRFPNDPEWVELIRIIYYKKKNFATVIALLLSGTLSKLFLFLFPKCLALREQRKTMN